MTEAAASGLGPIRTGVRTDTHPMLPINAALGFAEI
jgi:hypothetical protein